MEKRSVAGVLAGLLAAGNMLASGLPSQAEFKDNGIIKIGEAEFAIQSYDGGWRPSLISNWDKRKVTRKSDGIELRGGIVVGSVTGQGEQVIRGLDGNSFSLDAKVTFKPAATLNGLYGSLFVPEGMEGVEIDGKEVSLPRKFKELTVFSRNKVDVLKLRLSGGISLTVGGPFKLAIQDNRKFDQPNFSLRFGFSQSSGEISESALQLKFTIDTVKNRNVDISGIANRGFADGKAGDGKGGWSDQGPENDMRALKLNSLQVQGLRFDIINPARNHGNSVAVLGGVMRESLPHELSIALPGDFKTGAVNLLHASAWTPENGKRLGEIEVAYANGSKQVIPVESGRDCGNWWIQSSMKNASVAWKAENASSPIGIYASSFALNRKDATGMTFRAVDPKVMWMLVGVNLSEEAVSFAIPVERELYVVANREWLPLEFKRETVKGSVLDFSWVADAPAGKYGFITVSPQGHLNFENAPEKRIRLYGPNLCFSASFLDKETVDKLAETFVRCGYNTVRIHHHDTEMIDPKAADTLTFSAEKLDRLDYLFYVMKKHGLYITTDFYTNRVFKPGDNIPECGYFNVRQMKTLLPVSKAAMDNWKEFARRWMNHRNPYTGLTWGSDPALFAINLVNEETLSNNWATAPEGVELYRKRFDIWRKERGITDGRVDSSDRVFASFLHELQSKCLDEQMRFVKEELKLKTLVTSLNYINAVPLALQRDKFDLVDNHAYFDHPSFPEKKWQAPFGYRQESAITRMASVPARMMPTRVFGKPFMVTEFNYCNPNIHRAEGGPVIGAYSALQDWDALYRFAWSHSSASMTKLTPAAGFDAVNDPMAQLSDRISIAMFVRGDFSPAKQKFAYMVSPDIFKGNDPLNFPSAFEHLGLIAQTGSAVEGGKLPPGVTPISPDNATKPQSLADKNIAKLWQNAISERKAVSSTGGITLDAVNKTFAAKSPRSESITLAKGALSAGIMSVKNASGFQSVSAIAMDGRELADSKSIMIIHLTNVANTKMHFGNERKTLLKDRGELPLLIQRATAMVELGVPAEFKVDALSADGGVLGQVKGTLESGRFSFTADPGCFPGGVMVYHLSR